MIDTYAIETEETAAGSAIRPVFGVVFELNGTPVPISSDSITNFQQNGFSFTLPEPIEIGTPDDFLAWMDRTFGTDLQKTLDPNTLPTPIAQLVNCLLNANLSVYPVSIKIPPKDSLDPVTYALGLIAEFPGGGLPIIPGSDLLLLASFDLSVTNNPTFGGPAPGGNTEI